MGRSQAHRFPGAFEGFGCVDDIVPGEGVRRLRSRRKWLSRIFFCANQQKHDSIVSLTLACHLGPKVLRRSVSSVRGASSVPENARAPGLRTYGQRQAFPRNSAMAAKFPNCQYKYAHQARVP